MKIRELLSKLKQEELNREERKGIKACPNYFIYLHIFFFHKLKEISP